jgi:hypothetical protein
MSRIVLRMGCEDIIGGAIAAVKADSLVAPFRI